MKIIIAISVGLAACAAFALLAQPPVTPGAFPGGPKGGAPKAPPAKPAGEVLFGSECATCHLAGEASRAPALETLRQLPADAVLTALTTGRMSTQALRLSPADRVAVAEFVTGKTVSTASVAPGGQCDTKSKGSADGLGAGLGKGSWNGWGGTAAGNRFIDNGGLKAADVPRLRLAWAFGFPRALSVRTQPTVVGDWLFTGGETGEVYALDAKSGCIRWTYQAKAGVRGALSVAAFSSGKFGVYFGDGQANAYGLDAVTGKELWILKVETHPNAAVTAAPVVYNGRVYVPVSAVGEESRGQDPTYACCSFRGSITSIDLLTGERIWKSYTIPEEPRPRGKSSAGTELLGPAGAGVWGAPTLDAKRGLLYVGTGNGYAGPPQKTMNAVIAIDLKTGTHKWVQQTIPNDVWLMQCQSQSSAKGKQVNPNCPDEEGPDFDFSAAPLITTTAAGRDLIVIPQKSGVIWALDPDKGGEVVWQYRYGQGSGLGGQWGAAADGVNAYIGTGDAFSPNPGGLHAVNLETGKRAWSMPPQQKLCGAARGCSSGQAGAISAIPGAIFSAGADGGVRAYASLDGAILWTFDTNRPFKTVNGVEASGGTMDASGVAVSGGMVYVNSGYGGVVGRPGNVLLAFRVE
ncbi:MAG TPA: PQQ-binding-like beta-propeller repeat protein [Bryobacteraceae bacterium]|jgi:polyvinyl alcohol dehydrogenase (cytochrome)